MKKSYAILIVLSVIFILPLLITITNSFISEAEIGLNYTTKLSTFDVVGGITQKFVKFVLIPASVTLSQYIAVLFEQPTFIVLLMNSIKIIASCVRQYGGITALCICLHNMEVETQRENFFRLYNCNADAAPSCFSSQLHHCRLDEYKNELPCYYTSRDFFSLWSFLA